MVLVGEVIGALVQAQRPDRVLRRLETSGDQLLLESLRIRGKKVEVDGRAERPARIATCDLRAFQEENGLIGRGLDPGEDVRCDRVPDGRELLLRAQLVGHLATELAPAPAGEKLQPVGPERRQPGRRVDELVDARPDDWRAAHGRRVFSRLGIGDDSLDHARKLVQPKRADEVGDAHGRGEPGDPTEAPLAVRQGRQPEAQQP